MLRIVLAIAVLGWGALTPALAQDAAAGQRVALVIGNSAYAHAAARPHAGKDAEAVAATLRGVGFAAVRVVTDVTAEQLRSALDAFAGESARADWAVVYFSGHGIQIGGEQLLLPIDATMESEAAARTAAVSIERVLAVTGRVKTMRLVMSDAGRNNPFAGAGRVPGGVAAEPGTVASPAATAILYATGAGKKLDADGDVSPLAAAIVRHVATPGLEITQLFRRVRDDVIGATNGRQIPAFYLGGSSAPLYFRAAQ